MTDGRDPDRPREPESGTGEDEPASVTPGSDQDREDADRDETAAADARAEADAKSEAKASGDAGASARAPAPRRGGRAGVLALLLVLALIAALAWPVWLVLGEQRDPLALVPSKRLAALEQRLETVERVQAEVRDNRQALEASSRRDAALESRIDDLQRAFSRLSSDLNAETPLDERQWRIAEAAYLLRVAQLRARMENDREGARALLEAADELIAELDDLGLYPVREAIADALAALRAGPVVDRVGLYLELESLSERVAALPLELPRFRTGGEPSSDTEQDWLATLQDRLSGLFDFRAHRPEPVTPLMAPDQAFHLRHNLLLLLEQAQLALLRGDSTVWEDTLGEARRWVREYFDPEKAEIAALDRALERLSRERVAAEAPDISAPLNELQRLRGRAEATP